jgi:3-oxoacyl-(acyl-carrier-protein) synthase
MLLIKGSGKKGPESKKRPEGWPRQGSARQLKMDKKAENLQKQWKAQVRKMKVWGEKNKDRLGPEEALKQIYEKGLRIFKKMDKRIVTVATGVALDAAGIKDKKAKAEIHKAMQAALGIGSQLHKPGEGPFFEALERVERAGGNLGVFIEVLFGVYESNIAITQERRRMRQ